MEWIRQAFPSTPQEVVDRILQQSNGDVVEAVRRIRSNEGLARK